MFGTFSEQLKKSAEPVSSLVALNAKTLETLAGYQTALFTGLLDDSASYLKSVKDSPDVKHILAAQSECAASARDRVASTTKETYHTLNQLRDDATDVLRTTLNNTAARPLQQAKTMTEATQATLLSASKAANTSATSTPANSKKGAKPTVSKSTATTTKPASTAATPAAKKADVTAKAEQKNTQSDTTAVAGKKTPDSASATSTGAEATNTSKSASPGKRASTARKSAASKSTK